MAPEQRRVVQRISGPGTVTGDGDILVDQFGKHYRVVSNAEAQMARSTTTVGSVFTVDERGFIR